MSAPQAAVLTAVSPAVLTYSSVQAESPFTEPAPICDQATKAALKYFESTDNTAREDAFDHLVAILSKAKGNLFLVEDDMTPFEASRRFLEGWLVERLFRYHGVDADTIRQAARKGEFRYLGKQGRCALIDEIRRRSRSEDALDRHSTEDERWLGLPPKVVHIDAASDDDDGGRSIALENSLALDPDQGLGSAIGRKPALEPSVVRDKLRSLPGEVRDLLGERLFSVLSIICDLFPDNLARKGDVSAAISAASGVSTQTARHLHRELTQTLGMAKENSAVRDLFRFIGGAGAPTVLLRSCTWIPQNQAG
jgi:hypothetical protein